MSAVKQTRPFRAIIPMSYRRSLIADSKKYGQHYGVFFDTSGKCRCERINPTAQYDYVFRTDETNLKPGKAAQ